jgi:hypothetical protein
MKFSSKVSLGLLTFLVSTSLTETSASQQGVKPKVARPPRPGVVKSAAAQGSVLLKPQAKPQGLGKKAGPSQAEVAKPRTNISAKLVSVMKARLDALKIDSRQEENTDIGKILFKLGLQEFTKGQFKAAMQLKALGLGFTQPTVEIGEKLVRIGFEKFTAEQFNGVYELQAQHGVPEFTRTEVIAAGKLKAAGLPVHPDNLETGRYLVTLDMADAFNTPAFEIAHELRTQYGILDFTRVDVMTAEKLKAAGFSINRDNLAIGHNLFTLKMDGHFDARTFEVVYTLMGKQDAAGQASILRLEADSPDWREYILSGVGLLNAGLPLTLDNAKIYKKLASIIGGANITQRHLNVATQLVKENIISMGFLEKRHIEGGLKLVDTHVAIKEENFRSVEALVDSKIYHFTGDDIDAVNQLQRCYNGQYKNCYDYRKETNISLALFFKKANIEISPYTIETGGKLRSLGIHNITQTHIEVSRDVKQINSVFTRADFDLGMLLKERGIGINANAFQAGQQLLQAGITDFTQAHTDMIYSLPQGLNGPQKKDIIVGIQLMKAQGYFSLDHLKIGKALIDGGIPNFTKEQVDLAKSVLSDYPQIEKADFRLGMKLKEKYIDVKPNNLKTGNALLALGIPDFTNEQFDLATAVLSAYPQIQRADFKLGMGLKEKGIDVNVNNLKTAKALLAMGMTRELTKDQFSVATELMLVGGERITSEDISLGMILKEKGVDINARNLEAGRKLIGLEILDITKDHVRVVKAIQEDNIVLNKENINVGMQILKVNSYLWREMIERGKTLVVLGIPDFTNKHLRAVERLQHIEAAVTKENIDACTQLLNCYLDINVKNLEVGKALVSSGIPDFTRQMVEVGTQLLKIDVPLTREGIEVGKQLAPLFLYDFTKDQFDIAALIILACGGISEKEDISLGRQLKEKEIDINKNNLQAGRRLVSLDIPDFTKDQVVVVNQLERAGYAFYLRREEIDLGMYLKAIDIDITRDNMEMGERFLGLGIPDFTKDHVDMVNRLEEAGYSFYHLSREQIDLGMYLKAINIDITRNNIEMGEGLVRLEIFRFTKDHVDVVNRLEEAGYPFYNLNRARVDLGMHLKSIGIDITSEAIEIGEKLGDTGVAGFTEQHVNMVKALTEIYEGGVNKEHIEAGLKLLKVGVVITRESKEYTEACMQLLNIRTAITHENLEAGQKLLNAEIPDFKEEHVRMVKALIKMGLYANKESIDLGLQLLKTRVAITRENVEAGQKLLNAEISDFREEHVRMVKALTKIYEGKTSKEHIEAGLQLLENRIDITDKSVEIGRKLTNAGFPEFTRTEFSAGEHLFRQGLPVTHETVNISLGWVRDGAPTGAANSNWLLNFASRVRGALNKRGSLVGASKQSLSDRVRDFIIQKLADADRPDDKFYIDMGYSLLHAGMDEFTEENLSRAERIMMDAGYALDRERLRDFKFVENTIKNWGCVSYEDRLSCLISRVFHQQSVRQSAGIPADRESQERIRELVFEWMRDGTVKKPSIDDDFRKVRGARQTDFGAVLARASGVFAAMETGMDYRGALDFYSFQTDYKKRAKNFPLEISQMISLYQTLNGLSRGRLSLDETKTALCCLLERSFPMDYSQWPTKPEDTFEPLIREIVLDAAEAVSGAEDQEKALQGYINRYLERRNEERRAELRQKIGHYKGLNNAANAGQLVNHGHKRTLFNNDNFAGITGLINTTLEAMDREFAGIAALNQKINFSYLCGDPFLCLLREPDERLWVIERGSGSLEEEVAALKNWVDTHYPIGGADRSAYGDEDAFDKVFSPARNGMYQLVQTGPDRDKCIKAVARLKRLYEVIKAKSGNFEAAKMVYHFACTNADRCIDGKGAGLADVERQHVYVADRMGAASDFNSILGLNFAKLFMDHRMAALKETIDALYAPGEPNTYGWFRSHRALYLGFGLTGDFQEMAFGNYHQEGVDPARFTRAYFEGGQLEGMEEMEEELGGRRYHHLPGFSADTMAGLILAEVRKPLGGLFNDEVLDYMIHSDLTLRKAWDEFQSHVDDENAFDYENGFFKNCHEPLRGAIKEEAIQRVLVRYGYMSERDEDGNWRP